MADNDLGPTVLERDAMAKKKAEEKPKPQQDIILVYKADSRVSAEFKAWLEELAADVPVPVSVLIDIALQEYAKSRKFRSMPKRLKR